jgi:hypothetical protein
MNNLVMEEEWSEEEEEEWEEFEEEWEEEL